MDSSVSINITKLLKSQLGLLDFIALQLIQNKDFISLKLLLSHEIELREIEACTSLSDMAPTDDHIDVVVKRFICELESSGWIKITGEDILRNLEIRQKFIEISEPDGLSERINDVENWFQSYRDLFKGRKPGSMGDGSSVIDKLKRFIKLHPQYTKEQILTATKRYIATESPRYLQRADYFIFKQDVNKIEMSRLLSFLEESAHTPRDYDPTKPI